MIMNRNNRGTNHKQRKKTKDQCKRRKKLSIRKPNFQFYYIGLIVGIVLLFVSYRFKKKVWVIAPLVTLSVLICCMISVLVKILPLSYVIGSHSGPGTVALFFTGDTRTEK